MKLSDKLRVRPGRRMRLAKIDPGSTPGFADKIETEKPMDALLQRMEELQYLLYAENKRALLIIFQAMDAAGKDGVIRRVMGAFNPQGCRVTSFKVPSEEERAHDFLWRIHKAVPRKGEVGVFNRSHYEEVLVVRVRDLAPKQVWQRRYDQINRFEEHLAANGVTILKFFLHISSDEQKARLVKRLKDPTRHWKVNPADFDERKYWDDYMRAYEDALNRCSTPWAPWYVIPANKKWFRNVAVASIIVEALKRLNMKYPKPTCDLSKIRIR